MKAFSAWILPTVVSTFPGALRADLFVTGNATLYQVNELTGAYIARTALTTGLFAVAIGPDGNPFVAGGSGILEFSDTTDKLLSVFVPTGIGGLNNPTGRLGFGPNGNLYVGNSTGSGNEILEYSGATGAFLTTFVSPGSGGVGSGGGFVFGPNGNLFLAGIFLNEILEYSGTTGAFMKTFVTAGSGGLNAPEYLTFGPDHNLYVSSFQTSQILEYSGTTGAFIGAFVAAGSGGLSNPLGLEFGPKGNLFVASEISSEILEYNGTTGAYVGGFADVIDPQDLAFDSSTPEPTYLFALGLGFVGLGLANAWNKRLGVISRDTVAPLASPGEGCCRGVCTGFFTEPLAGASRPHWQAVPESSV